MKKSHTTRPTVLFRLVLVAGLLAYAGGALGAAGAGSGQARASGSPPGGLADLNGDGFANVLDAHRARAAGFEPSGERRQQAAGSETIFVENDLRFVKAGDPFSIRIKLTQNTFALFGYSLDVAAVPLEGTVGSMAAVVEMTNFYEPQNLITAAGGCEPDCPELDRLFSVILDSGDGGVFVSANTDDGSTVLAQDDVNDVLAEVFFTPAPGSSGAFEFSLGPASALSDGNGFAVPFVFVAGAIEAFPDPADFNLDGAVDFADLIDLLIHWGTCDVCGFETCPWDTDGNCGVAFNDLTMVLVSWG